jgi:hypothetical protein
MKRKVGFCYVASTPGYLEEAMHSLASLRIHMTYIPVAVVTTRELFRSEALVTDWIELPEGRSGPIVKTAAHLAPYDRVIFLDTDTYVSGDLSGLFNILDAFDLVVAPDVTRGYEYERNIPNAFCEYNTGVIAFRNSPKVQAIFRYWEEKYDLLQAQYGVKTDQAAFRTALWMIPIVRHAAMSSEYNFIACVPNSVNGSVKLLHDRSDNLPGLALNLNREVGPRVFAPGWGTIFGYRGRRQWIRDYLRLTRIFFRVLLNPSSIRQNETPVKWWEEEENEAKRSKRPILTS